MPLHWITFFEPETKPYQFIIQPTRKRRVGEHKLAGQTDFIGCACIVSALSCCRLAWRMILMIRTLQKLVSASFSMSLSSTNF